MRTMILIIICVLLTCPAFGQTVPIEQLCRLEFPFPVDRLNLSFQNNEGDLNGDGYDDIAVGDPDLQVDDSTFGIAYVFLGGVNFDNRADLILTGDHYHNPPRTPQFGTAVEIIGDLNNDGYDDLAVTDPEYLTENWHGVGRVYIYYGGDPVDSIVDVTLDGCHYYHFFGNYAAGPGDINGDGYDDLAVTAWRYLSGENYEKSWYIYFGGDPFDTEYDLERSELRSTYQTYGIYGNRRVDVNADGYDDIMVNDDPWNTVILTKIYFGSESPDTSTDFILRRYDFAVVDVNGDGRDDIATPENELYYCGERFDTRPDHYLQQEFRNAAGCGDVNFDGVDDFLTGHYTRDAVRFYFGGNPPDSSSSWGTTFTGLQHDMVLLGDVNGDHWKEILFHSSENDSSRVWIYRTRPFQVGADLAINLIPDEYPVFVLPGESFAFTGQILNALRHQTTTDVWLKVRTAPGNYFELDRWRNVFLEPFQIISISGITRRIPRTAMCGEYYFISYCGDYPDGIVDSSYFRVYVECRAVYDQMGFRPGDDRFCFKGVDREIPGRSRIQLKAFPNPFNATTTIHYRIDQEIVRGDPAIAIYNILGRKVTQLNLPRGSTGGSVSWNAANSASGIYFARIVDSGNGYQYPYTTMRMLLIK